MVRCTNVHGKLSILQKNIQLEDLKPFTSKFYNHRPRMLKYNKDGISILIFTSLCFRIMGKGEKHEQVMQEFIRSLPWSCHVSILSKSMTMTYQLPIYHINLHNLNRDYFQVELELFPAAKLLHSQKSHVNIFHSGKVVLLGMRSVEHALRLIANVMECINK